MNTQPLGNRIHIKPLPRPSASAGAGGIIIPAKYSDPKVFAQYQVLAVGPGRKTKKGKRVPIELAPGDLILTSLYEDHQTLADGTKLIDADQVEMAWRE